MTARPAAGKSGVHQRPVSMVSGGINPPDIRPRRPASWQHDVVTLSVESARKLNRIRARRAALRADEAAAIREARETSPQTSLREIADQVGLSHTQVRRILEQAPGG